MNRRNSASLLSPTLLLWAALNLAIVGQAKASKSPYPSMAPIAQYLMAESAEVALARSAAPASISGNATIAVLKPHGYETAVKGQNGFVCIVERLMDVALRLAGVLESQDARSDLFQSARRSDGTAVYLQKD